MFSLFRKNLLFLPFYRSSSSSSSSQVQKLFITSQAREFSSSSSSSPQAAHSRSVNVFVWWDADECKVPSGISFSKVAPSIKAAVRANGINGYIQIHAYGDFYSSKFDDEALMSTGIRVRPITEGKNDAHKCILMNLENWVSKNPPPAHLFLIFGNGDFSGILNRLRMWNYNILLACPGRAHVALYHAATIMWQWSSMLKGEDLIGKHFNYPPDDPFNSWYGNSNVPLENPFLVVEQLTSSQNAEIYKPPSDIKFGEASKSISRQVMKILSSHLNGISIGDLRAELTKYDPPLGKRFYGFKKFSNFLLSIPHVQLQYLGEGYFWVSLVPSMTTAVKNKQEDGTATPKLHNEGKNIDRSADGIPRISSSYVSNEGDDSKSFQSMPSQGKPIGDGKSLFPPFKESKVHQDVICSRKPKLFEDSKLSEVDQSASHFEEPKSLEIQQDVSHRRQPHWDDIRVWVWWDFNTCGVPSDISFLNVAPSIMGVLRANGIKGPIHIDAYGDVSQFSEIEQEALLLTGIDLHHIPGGKHNSSHKWLMDWVSLKPPRAHLFLISGDTHFYFSGTVHRLGRGDDNIFLAWPSRGHFSVHLAATIVWSWSSILKGKYLTGKYFNDPPHWYIKRRVPLEYPPDWYRNSKVPLENPFSAAEKPTSSQNEEIHDPSSYIKLVHVPKSFSWKVRKISSFEVPKSLSRQVRKILSSYPNGISIGDLRLQFRLRYLRYLGKGFYEQEEFCNILVTIPHVQLLYIGEDNFCVRLIPSTTSAVKNKQRPIKNRQRAIKNEHRGIKNSGMPVLFSTGSFWDDVESFVFTSRGSRILSRSRSREDLAHKLQRHGPLFLTSLTRNDIHQLVELMIAEKKWLEESPSQAFPFRLIQSIQKSSLMAQSHGANGFRSLFLNKTPRSNLQKSLKNDVKTYC